MPNLIIIDEAESFFTANPNTDPAITFVSLTLLAETIASSGAEWDDIYDQIFSDKISGQIAATGIEFEYADPDTSYKDDVLVYVWALRERTNELLLEISKCP